jgi:hypothetical protein
VGIRAAGDDTTIVKISPTGFIGSGDEPVQQVTDPKEGFSLVLAGLNAYSSTTFSSIWSRTGSPREAKNDEPTSHERLSRMVAPSGRTTERSGVLRT